MNYLFSLINMTVPTTTTAIAVATGAVAKSFGMYLPSFVNANVLIVLLFLLVFII